MTEVTTRGNHLTGGWQRSRVEISVAGTGENMRIVAAYVHADVKGLALTPTTSKDPNDRGRFSITHIATGREIAECTSLRNAQRIALDLAPLAQWTEGNPAGTQWRSPADLFAAVTRTVEAHASGGGPIRGLGRLRPKDRGETAERQAKGWLGKAVELYRAAGDAGAADRIERALDVLNEGKP